MDFGWLVQKWIKLDHFYSYDPVLLVFGPKNQFYTNVKPYYEKSIYGQTADVRWPESHYTKLRFKGRELDMRKQEIHFPFYKYQLLPLHENDTVGAHFWT